MSEADKAPVIQLSVDQEVFVDSVRDGDVIEDATVATEVTSFDRIGDAYVLEGAIVFAGYLTRADQLQREVSRDFDTLSIDFDEGPYAQHVHHRMPFVLRVPVRAQPRGIVNVKSRIAAWKLEVLGAGWLRVVADLTVAGLNGASGYHFQCGAQEQGDLFFDRLWNVDLDAEPEVRSEAADFASEEESVFPESAGTFPVGEDHTASLNQEGFVHDGTPVETAGWLRSYPNHPLTDAASGRGREEPTTTDFPAQAEAVSAARGGFELYPEADGATEWQAPPAAPEFNQEASLYTDRAGAGSPTADGTESVEPGADFEAQVPASDVTTPVEASAPEPREQPQASAETAPQAFEFEHQVSVEDDASGEPPHTPDQEEFVASRSFGDDGFHAASGFVPTVRVGSDFGYGGSRSDESEFDATPRSEYAEGAHSFADGAKVDHDLWSFVDFNGPENKYTLRYTIVMEEETLELVAERVGCSKYDLMKANGLDTESVRSGQPLLVPATVPVLRP